MEADDNDMSDRLLDYMQKCMWDQLAVDLRMAINGRWSMAAESTVTRIVWLARHRGVTDPGEVSIPLLASGVYHAVAKLAGHHPTISLDLDNYIDYWGDYQQLMLAIPEIQKMEVEDFAE